MIWKGMGIVIGLGISRKGKERKCKAWQGKAGYGKERQRKAWHGMVWQDKAWHGKKR
jgi:hypothetical protein